MRQVYEVRVEISVYVIAESEEEACREGKWAVQRGHEDAAFEIDAEPLGKMPRSKGVMRSRPYNAPSTARHWTVEEWVSATPPEEEHEDTRTLPLFPLQSSEEPKP